MAAAGGEVVDGRRSRLRPRNHSKARMASRRVRGVAGDEEGLDLGLDQRGGFERLLVAVIGRGFAAPAAVVADQPQPLAVDVRLARVPRQRAQALLE